LKPVKVRSRLLSKRKRDALTLYGALIVFVTFVVKEGIRDFMRDNVSSLDAVEIAYFTHAQNLGTFDLVADLSFKVNAISDAVLPPSRDFVRANRKEIESAVFASQMSVTQTKMLFQFVNDLVGKLPNSEKDIKREARELDRRLETVSDNEDTLVHILKDPKSDDGTDNKALHDLAKEEHVAEQLNADIITFSDRVFRTFRERKRDAQRVVNVSTWVSYALFTLGWGLALIGRLYGVESPAGTD
jgi:hypothetical protein